MAIKRWSEWLDDVMPSLPGSPPIALVEASLRRATINFCARSRFLRLSVDPIMVDAGEALYDIDIDTSVTVEKIESATLDGRPLVEASDDDLAGEYRSKVGVVEMFALEDPDQIRLINVPESAGELLIRVSLKPRQSAAGVESVVFEQFRQPIASGALAVLMAMPKKPWTDVGLAGYHTDQFERGIAAAEARIARAGTRASLRTVAHWRA